MISYGDVGRGVSCWRHGDATIVPQYLRETIRARSYFEHPEDHPEVSGPQRNDAAKRVRRGLLGIYNEAPIVRRLLEIKTSMGKSEGQRW